MCRLLRGIVAPMLAVGVAAFAASVDLPPRPADDAGRDAAGRAGPTPSTVERAVIIPITDEINDVTTESLKRRIERAKETGAELIIFEMNTPGGSVGAMLEITTLIKQLDPIRTVAWINPKAYSAGTIIALACNEIVVAPASYIGDCQPIMVTPEGVGAVPESIEAKVVSPLISDVRDSARKRGYPYELCLSLIRPDMEIFWVEHDKTAERQFVTRATRDDLFGIERTRPPKTTIEKTAKVEDQMGQKVEKVDTKVVSTPGEEVSDADSKTDWHYVKNHPLLGKVTQPIVPSDLLLTMSQDEAIAYGFAKAMLADEDALRNHYGITGEIEHLHYTWSEGLVDFLTSPYVRAILLILMLLGAYVEFNTPGVGVPGIAALVCLAIFLGAPYLTGLADAYEILIILVGIALVALEIFVIPGFGLAGIAGAVLIIAGLIATFMPAEGTGPIFWPEFDYTFQGLKTGLLVLMAGLVGTIIGGIALSRVLPRVPYAGRIVAPNPTPEAVAMEDPYPDAAKVGDIGVAEGILRPAGKARFGATLVDVVTEGDFVKPGTRVEVIERHGNRVVVRQVRA